MIVRRRCCAISSMTLRRRRKAPAEEQEKSTLEPEVSEPDPIPVQIRQPDPAPLQMLQTIVGPLIQPLATTGIVIVLVVFMLLKREDLRDRFIRLFGTGDLHRTTQALGDAAERVGRYLLMQLVVNVAYGIPIGIGLWLIGVPNPLLWGMLSIVLRFVPFIGPIIAAAFPLALSIAVDPGWTMLLWTAALFIVLELISGNIVEPWLYGASTGLSSIAILAAAIFWTWLWGPVGLLLSTPLTVCLVVLGRHVQQFGFLNVLLGSEPVLEPAESLYQRLLAGDPDEASERAEEYLKTHSVLTYFEDVAIPALSMFEHDRARGVLTDERRALVAAGALTLVDNLSEHEDAIGQDEAPESRRGTGTARTRSAREDRTWRRLAGPPGLVRRGTRQSRRCGGSNPCPAVRTTWSRHACRIVPGPRNWNLFQLGPGRRPSNLPVLHEPGLDRACTLCGAAAPAPHERPDRRGVLVRRPGRSRSS